MVKLERPADQVDRQGHKTGKTPHNELSQSGLNLDIGQIRSSKVQTEEIAESPVTVANPFVSSANTHENFIVSKEQSEQDGSNNEIRHNTSLHRRSSAATKPNAHTLLNGTDTRITSESVFDTTTIPPPVPESLPTTPGYELDAEGYFDKPTRKKYGLPHQQTVLAASGVAEMPSLDTFTSTAMGKSDSQIQRTTVKAKKLEDVSHGILADNWREKWRLVAVILFCVSAGLSDGAPGALLPRMEKYYDISYTIVSMIWMANALGFILVAVVSHKLLPWFGPRKLLGFGCASLAIMYAMVCSAPKFPIVAVGFFFGGIGLATNYSFQNIFLSRFQKSSTYLGYYHGSYGLGAFIAPLVATAMVNQGMKWSHYYFLMLALSIFNMFNLFFSFKGYEEEQKVWDSYDPLMEKSQQVDQLESQSIELHNIKQKNVGSSSMAKVSVKKPNKKNGSSGVTESTFEEVNPNNKSQKPASTSTEELIASLKSPTTWYLSIFVLCYQGAEVSMGGWVVTFLEVYRHGSSRTTGYVASGFWGGLTIGRFLLTPNIHRTIGAKRGVTLLVLISLVCCLLGWLLPVIIAEALFVALFGVFTGPIYPLMVTVAVRVLPRKIQVISMTIMTALGSSGGAIFPFLVGLVSQYAGTFVVMPFVLGLLSSALGLWALLPNPDRLAVRHIWERVL